MLTWVLVLQVVRRISQAPHHRKALLPFRPCSSPAAEQALQPDADNTAAVTRELRSFGVPLRTIDKILTRYPSCSNWSVNEKLRPAVQAWQAAMGPEQLSDRLHSLPMMLLWTPGEVKGLLAWLSCLGIDDSEQVLKAYPDLAHNHLTTLQQGVAMFQTYGVKDIGQLVRRNRYILRYSDETIKQTCEALTEVLQVPAGSPKFDKTLSKCSREEIGMFNMKPSAFVSRVNSFCQKFACNQGACKRALLAGIHKVPAEQIEGRAAALKDMLEITDAQLQLLLCRKPDSIDNQV